MLGGFLGRYDGELWERDGESVRFRANPVAFVETLYRYLDLEDRPGQPPSEKIWAHDESILEEAQAFYAEVEQRTGAADFAALEALFGDERGGAGRLCDGDEALWKACLAAHRGFQAGLELLLLVPRLGLRCEFLDVHVDDELVVHFPERFKDADRIAEQTRALAPPPVASADEIVTPMGGVFYAREAPHLPPMIEEGAHFEAGQPLFIIEVMKMFNKVPAPFAGTVLESRMKDRDGHVVAKGEVIFRIEPDERVEVESPEDVAARRREVTLALL
jgi:biotin carboxyl carrier protein